MKKRYASASMQALCDLLGFSRQAYYQQLQSGKQQMMKEEIILKAVMEIRSLQPKVGVRKLMIHLQDALTNHGIRLGRDALFTLLRERGLLIRQRKRRKITTNSNHPFRKYPNLTKGLTPLKSNELWVSDITYVDTDEGFVYLFLITDAYSHKIMGYAVRQTLEAQGALAALQMALHSRSTNHPLIHHSDRGIQYCSYAYITCLSQQPNPIQISMTENGDPRENAIAERVNGIIKSEFLLGQAPTKAAAQIAIENAIQTYNNTRLHSSVDMLTPQQAHQKIGNLKKHWKSNTQLSFSP